MNSCDIINKIHATFDEKTIPNMPNQRFHLSDWWTRSLSTDVSGRSLKILTSMDGFWKLMSDINQQVMHYITCVCLCFLRFSLEMYKIMVSNRSPLKSFPTLSKEVIAWHRNFELYSNFGFFTTNFSRNAVPVHEVTYYSAQSDIFK